MAEIRKEIESSIVENTKHTALKTIRETTKETVMETNQQQLEQRTETGTVKQRCGVLRNAAGNDYTNNQSRKDITLVE